MSKTRDSLLDDLDMLGFEREVPFRGISGKRRWRWDAAKELPDEGGSRRGVAVEYNGIGAHTSFVEGTWRDHEKVTEGQLCGWIVVQCNVATVRDGRCWSWVLRALGEYEEPT